MTSTQKRDGRLQLRPKLIAIAGATEKVYSLLISEILYLLLHCKVVYSQLIIELSWSQLCFTFSLYVC